MKTHRRTVAAVAAQGVAAARTVYTGVPSDAIRVAALVEIAAAAAALARTVVKLRHLDPDLIAPHVCDLADLRAVLGRGRWLPTMTRHVPAPSTEPVPLAVLLPAVMSRSARRRVARRVIIPGQLSLSLPPGRGGEP